MSKRKSLSIADKLLLLKNVDDGMRKKDVAIKFDVPPSTVSTIIKNRESVLKMNEESAPGRKRSKICHFDKVDEAVLKWIKIVRDKNLPITGPLIKEKALEFANRLNQGDFQASSGWLDKFKKRHGIKEKIISGESKSVCEADCDQWRDTVLKEILNEFTPDNIFNADETGLFFKCLPNKTLTFKGDECHGDKKSKERITVLVGANMNGKEKLKLLVIGKSKHPRCFKGVKSLEVDYNFNKKAWMTSSIFEEWLLNLNKKMKRQKRKIALVIDNCPGHPNVSSKLSHVKLIFLPPNATSILQPMDQGVIKNLKVHYKKRILRRLISALENDLSTHEVVNLRICIAELSKVWQNDVLETTIKNCFAKAGFIESTPIEEENVLPQVEKCWEDLQTKGAINEGVSIEDFLDIDKDLNVAEYPTDDDIVNSVQNEQMNIEENTEEYYCKPSNKEMVAAFDTIRRGLQFFENVPDHVFHGLNNCEHFYDQSSSSVLIQQDIRHFFT